MKKLLGCFLCAMLLVFGISSAGAITLDLTDLTGPSSKSFPEGKGDNGYVNDAYFIVFTDDMQDTVSAGTGVIDPFLTVQKNGYEHGFNTDIAPPPLDTKRLGGPGDTGWTHSIQYEDLIFDSYYNSFEFLLDINESNDNSVEPSKDSSKLTLQSLEVYVVPFAEGADGFDEYSDLNESWLVWDLDGRHLDPLDPGYQVDNEVDLDYAFWQGSGQNMDLALYLPDNLFTGANDNDWIVMYSAFGSDGDPGPGNWSSQNGFEEWVLREGGESVPEPATMFLLGSGLIGLALLGRKKFIN